MGSVARIDRVPADLKALYATAFEVEPQWLVDAAARRQKWIDQAQSLNLYVAEPSGRKLDIMYRMAWQRGLKTTYYLRALAATSTEKSTLERGGQLNAVSSEAPVVAAMQTSDAPRPDAIPAEAVQRAETIQEVAMPDAMASTIELEGDPAAVPLACSLDDPDCEACQ